jgi:hypothetical protein
LKNKTVFDFSNATPQIITQSATPLGFWRAFGTPKTKFTKLNSKNINRF